MGVLVPRKPKPQPAPDPIIATAPAVTTTPRRKPRVLMWTGLAAAILLMLIGAGGLIAWSLSGDRRQVAVDLVQAPEPSPNNTRHETPPPPDLPAKSLPAKEKPSADQPKPNLLEPLKPIEATRPKSEPPAEVKKEPPPTVVKEPLSKPVVDTPKKKESEPAVVRNPPNLILPLKLVWKLEEGDVFFQDLVVTQKRTFRVPGLGAVPSVTQYRVVSRFTVEKAGADGSLVVQQKVESAKLLQADELTQLALAGAVEQLPGTTYTFNLSPKMDVTKIEGVAAAAGIKQIAGGLGFQTASLMDRDGWKELAQATFFQMEEPLKANVRWSKPMTHNWGALGTWDGRIHYQYLGQQGAIHKISYGLQLGHKAPAKAATIAGMRVDGAKFQVQQAVGMLLFDAERGKVVSAEEQFRVTGVLNGNLLGQATAIEIDEDQHFALRIHDKMPN